MFDDERGGNRGSILHSKLDDSSLNIGSLVEINKTVLLVPSN